MNRGMIKGDRILIFEGNKIEKTLLLLAAWINESSRKEQIEKCGQFLYCEEWRL